MSDFTPSQQIMAAANVSDTIRDSDGRELEVRRTTSREMRKFMRSCGDAADIDRWFGEASLAIQVRGINGIPIMMPVNADQADALVEKLGAAGLQAVVEWITKDQGEAKADPKN